MTREPHSSQHQKCQQHNIRQKEGKLTKTEVDTLTHVCTLTLPTRKHLPDAILFFLCTFTVQWGIYPRMAINITTII